MRCRRILPAMVLMVFASVPLSAQSVDGLPLDRAFVEDTIRLGFGGEGAEWDGQYLWITDPSSGVYKKYSTDTKTLVGAIPILAGGEGLAWDGTSLWSWDIPTGSLVQIDPTDGSILSTLFVEPIANGGLAYDGTHFWKARRPDFIAIDPVTGVIVDVISEFDLPGIEEGLAFDGRYLYAISYTDASDPRIWKIDPQNHTLQPDSFALPNGTYNGLAFDGRSLWAVNWSEQTVYKISVPADLIVTFVSDPPALAAPGALFTVSDITRNDGPGVAGESRNGYFLSATGARRDIRLVDGRFLLELSPGQESSGDSRVTIPARTAAGAYWFIACADTGDQVAEGDDTNNCLTANSKVTVEYPDLRQAAVSTAAAFASPTGKITVTDTVDNPSALTAPASTTRFYLSPDAVKNAGDILLIGKRAVQELSPSEISTDSAALTLPSGVANGSYYVLACADDLAKIKESNETNNCVASSTIILVGWADLVTTAVSDPPSTAPRGGKFTVVDTVRNQGTIPAVASSTRYYLSSDGVKNSGDVLLTGSRAVGSLAPGASSPGSRAVTVPLTTPLGTYRILACADDTGKVPEQDNANNCRPSETPVTIQGGRPILDQYNTKILSSSVNGGSSAYEWQQGITAGIAGQLTQIALFVQNSDSSGETAPTQVSVTLGSPWQSGAAAWTTTAVLHPGWNTFNVTNAKIFVAVGDEYAIGIHGHSQYNFDPGIGISYGEQYLGGDLFVNGSSAESEGNDFLFRTYVSP
jgi:hypothetical protein